MLPELASPEVYGAVFTVKQPQCCVELRWCDWHLTLCEIYHGLNPVLGFGAHGMFGQCFAYLLVRSVSGLLIYARNSLFCSPVYLPGVVDLPTLAVPDEPLPPQVAVPHVVAVACDQ